MWDLSPRSADRPAGSRRAPARRILTAGLGLGAVVATAAVAHASSDGDGFFNSQPNHHAEMRHVAPAVAGQAAAQSAWMWADGTPVTGNTQLPSFCLRATPAQNTQTQNGHWQDGRWVQNTQTQNTQTQNGHWQDGHWVQNASTSSDSADSGDSEDMDHWMSDNHGDDDDMPARAVFGRRWWGQPKVAVKVFVDRRDPTFNQLLGINDRGTIVGYYGSGEDAQHPNQGYWTDSPYGQGNFRDENYPGSVQTQVIGITKHGDTAGFYVDDKGDNHGFVRWNGEWSEVNYPGSHFNQLLGINSAGIAVGFFNDAKGNAHGYTYNARTHAFVLIILPGRATAITVTGINDRNQVVGFATIGKVTVGFIWTSRHAIVIIRLGNGTNTQILGINNAGVVVGSFVDGHKRTHGFMKDNWRTRTIDAPHSASTVINGLNNKGQIVGFYTDNEEHTLGFLAHS